MFTGLSAFPLTPFRDDTLDSATYTKLIERLAEAGVDSIGALGSTGSYAYLTAAERATAAHLAVQAAGEVPVIVGVGAVSTREVMQHVHAAQAAGAAGLLLPAVAYQPLTDPEIFGLFERINRYCDIPIVVYDNPATTHTRLSDQLYASIADLPRVVSIKIPPLPDAPTAARERVDHLRSLAPTVTIGISGDPGATAGMIAGCDAWYSVIAGIWPATILGITRAVQRGDHAAAQEQAAHLDPVWALFARHGSFRVASAIAAEIGLTTSESTLHPVQPLAGRERDTLRAALSQLGPIAGFDRSARSI